MNRTVFAIGLIFLLICVSGVSSNVNISKISYSRKSNNPPYPPSNPYPPDGYTNVSIYPSVLRWTGGDPDGDTVRYDLYYGITFPPPLLFGNTSST